jgi:uracil-DNA glycosylase
LDDVLVALGIDRTKLFVTNAALCHTLEGDPKASAISSCSRIRLRTQELLKPKVIIALGRIAIAQYTGKTVTISKIHGVPFLHTQGTTAGPWTTTVVPTYHPAAILRKMLHASGEDLHAQATSAAIIANEKWNLYDDLATAFHTLDAPTLTSLLLPGKGLGPNGKLVTRTRSTLL